MDSGRNVRVAEVDLKPVARARRASAIVELMGSMNRETHWSPLPAELGVHSKPWRTAGVSWLASRNRRLTPPVRRYG